MKKILFPILISVIVLGMSNCDDDNVNEPVNPLIGTWERENNYEGERLTFTLNRVNYFYVQLYDGKETPSRLEENGVYQYDDTHIYIEFKNPSGTWNCLYVLDGEQLILTYPNPMSVDTEISNTYIRKH
jgi:hypothetical protein